MSFAPVTTGNHVTDALTSNQPFWGAGEGAGHDPGAAVTLAYSFQSADSVWAPSYSAANEPGAVTALTLAQQARFEDALQAWSNVAGLDFVRVEEAPASVGDIRVAYSDNLPADAYAWAYYPGGPVGGDIWLNDDHPALLGSDFVPGSYEFLALVHELGHALGLSHPDDNAFALDSADDTSRNTVMSHSHVAGYDASGLYFYPTTPMAYDIAAMQYLYGANMSYHSGDDNYVFDEAGSYLQTIWDAGGIDTITYNSAANGGVIDLTPGAWSDLGADVDGYYYDPGSHFVSFGDNVNIYHTVIIENAAGGDGADSITGNAVANTLSGNGGNDTLDGGLGQDNLLGGSGNDSLLGSGGNDTMDGGGGDDTLIGGGGNDIYLVHIALGVVLENLNQGTDAVRISVSYTLSANLENLALTGADAIDGTGNSLGNILTGNSGNNVLDGRGGADALKGLGGNDTLVWASTDTYDGGAGADTLRVTAGNLNLTAVANTRIKNVEQIDVTGGGNQKLTLSLSDVLDISSTTNTLTVVGNSGDSVDIVGSYTYQGTAGGFRSYKVGTGILLVETDITAVG